MSVRFHFDTGKIQDDGFRKFHQRQKYPETVSRLWGPVRPFQWPVRPF